MANPKFTSVITDILKREDSTLSGVVTNDPSDRGGRTQFGLTQRYNPTEWADGKVTQDEAREAYWRKYVEAPGFHRIPDSHGALRTQLIDFGANSGPRVAIQKLQMALGVTVDGDLGPKTLAAIEASDPLKLNNQLVAERVTMLVKLCQKEPSQLKWLGGWCNRALEFIS